MKKIVALFLAVGMLLAMTACGGGSDSGLKEGKTVEDFLSDMVDLLGVNLSDIDDSQLQDLYMVDMENVESYAGKMSQVNIQAYDILVVKAKEGKVEDVKASLEERKQNRIAEFEFYPVNDNDIHTKDALVLTSGDYAILVVCDNYDGAQEILDEYFTLDN